jgi:hypothetical protein
VGSGVGVGDAAEGEGCGSAAVPGQEDARNNRHKKIRRTRCIERIWEPVSLNKMGESEYR